MNKLIARISCERSILVVITTIWRLSQTCLLACACDPYDLYGDQVLHFSGNKLHILLVPWTKCGFLNIFSRQNFAGLFVTPIVSATAEQIWREKMPEKPPSIRLLRWFNFSQSGSRKNNRKTFEGASVEPTIYVSRRKSLITHYFVIFSFFFSQLFPSYLMLSHYGTLEVNILWKFSEVFILLWFG